MSHCFLLSFHNIVCPLGHKYNILGGTILLSFFARNTDSLINCFAAQRRIIIKQSFTLCSGKFYTAKSYFVLWVPTYDDIYCEKATKGLNKISICISTLGSTELSDCILMFLCLVDFSPLNRVGVYRWDWDIEAICLVVSDTWNDINTFQTVHHPYLRSNLCNGTRWMLKV